MLDDQRPKDLTGEEAGLSENSSSSWWKQTADPLPFTCVHLHLQKSVVRCHRNHADMSNKNQQYRKLLESLAQSSTDSQVKSNTMVEKTTSVKPKPTQLPRSKSNRNPQPRLPPITDYRPSGSAGSAAERNNHSVIKQTNRNSPKTNKGKPNTQSKFCTSLSSHTIPFDIRIAGRLSNNKTIKGNPTLSPNKYSTKVPTEATRGSHCPDLRNLNKDGLNNQKTTGSCYLSSIRMPVNEHKHVQSTGSIRMYSRPDVDQSIMESNHSHSNKQSKRFLGEITRSPVSSEMLVDYANRGRCTKSLTDEDDEKISNLFQNLKMIDKCSPSHKTTSDSDINEEHVNITRDLPYQGEGDFTGVIAQSKDTVQSHSADIISRLHAPSGIMSKSSSVKTGQVKSVSFAPDVKEISRESRSQPVPRTTYRNLVPYALSSLTVSAQEQLPAVLEKYMVRVVPATLHPKIDQRTANVIYIHDLRGISQT